MREIIEQGRARRYALWRRRLWLATAVAVVAHALLLAFFVFPDPDPPSSGLPTLTVLPMAPAAERPPRREIAPPVERESGGDRPAHATESRDAPIQRPDRRNAIPVVVETPGAPEETTIPSTALDADLRARTLPLEAGPAGVRRRAPDAETLARVRAESLANARLASLPGARRQDRGPVSLAEGGGVTIAIPWQGFLPENRKDERWREERCEGDGGDNDKAGESEARASQCS